MNTELFTYGLLHLGLSVLLSVFVLYMTFSQVTRYFKKKFQFAWDNTAFAIFISGLIFSVGYLFEGVNQPMLSAISFIRGNAHLGGSVFLECSKYVGLFLFIGMIFSVIVSLTSIYLFTILTKMFDEFAEISKGNVAVSIILTTVIVTMSFICRDSLISILESFIPYPDHTNFSN